MSTPTDRGNIPAARGNNPELWSKLLDALDEKLQLGLLDRMRRTTSYHFEDGILILEPGTGEDETYLRKPATMQQLTVLAQDVVGIREVRIKGRNE